MPSPGRSARDLELWPWSNRTVRIFISLNLMLMSLQIQCEAQSLAPLELPTGSGAWFGVSIDFFKDTVQSYMSSAGVQPVSVGVFVPLPMEPKNRTYLIDTLGQIAEVSTPQDQTSQSFSIQQHIFTCYLEVSAVSICLL
jgi:hypothetical protein